MIPQPRERRWSVDVRTDDPQASGPVAGDVLAYAQRRDDGWRIAHRDGREVCVATTVEVLERLLMVADRDGPVDTVLLVNHRPS